MGWSGYRAPCEIIGYNSYGAHVPTGLNICHYSAVVAEELKNVDIEGYIGTISISLYCGKNHKKRYEIQALITLKKFN